MNNEEKIDLILEKIEILEEKIEDNNNILHGDRNSKRWAKLFWIIKWVVIIAIGIVSWAYIQPIYSSIFETYKKISNTSDEIREATAGLNENLDKLENLNVKNVWEKLKD